MRYSSIAAMLILSMLIPGLAAAAIPIGSSHIHAPAVDLSQNVGALTNISVVITRGNGFVNITGPAEIASNTRASALAAAKYAAAYLGLNFSDYNFTYTIADIGANVSGPSAGAAMTVIAISALSHKPLLTNFTMTGTINNGSIGAVGGVYDKASAAQLGGMKFILVPAVSPGSLENELYYLVQGRFGLPLVQVATVAAALQYAYGIESPYGSQTNFTFYTNYQVQSIPYANITCSNSCDSSLFYPLANFTFRNTQSVISQLSLPGFAAARSQMQEVLNQSMAVAAKGYFYTGADFSFLDYINAFFFANSGATVNQGLSVLQQINSTCSSLAPPPLTMQNYEWVTQGELRQAWGSFTANSTISIYNVSSFDSDQVLESLYSAAEAKAWCNAAGYIYGSFGSGGTPATVSQALKGVADTRIARASAYGNNLYIATAEQAYAKGNYPLAVLDSDYAYAEGSANMYSGENTSTLISMTGSLALSQNATYGAWPTQFDNEALFYVQQSRMATNSTVAHNYAYQAYSTALLGYLLSNDTRVIYQNLIPGQPTTTSVQTPIGIGRALAFGLYLFLWIVVLMLVVVLILTVVILYFIIGPRGKPKRMKRKAGTRKRRARRRRRQ
ncbi:hypothetical protein M1397_02700 [Candidatus Marsarchaeota archaeon]|nr:hypothetical protein [Candidatus Marsarchaeota archaeon]